MITSSILGLNARTQLFTYKHNSFRAKRIAASKLLTKRTLKKANIPVPELYTKFKNPLAVFNFKWENLPDSFVLKPSKGFGGEGIVVLKRKAYAKEDPKKIIGWTSALRKLFTIEDLKLHSLDILEGAYSMGNVPDVAFIEEFVGRHKLLQKYAYRGTPDIRVIVFNKTPVLAMLRLPTKESGGRANIHQGAISVGIDIATGITTRAMHNGKFISNLPRPKSYEGVKRFKDVFDPEKLRQSFYSLQNLIINKPVYISSNKKSKKRKLNGVKIPHWNKILELAVQCQIDTGIGYLGADIILHPKKGPMVLELNSQPGLQIQLVNMVGLKRRLEKVDDLEIRDVEHGVRVAKALFSSSFANKVKVDDAFTTIKAVEDIIIHTQSGKKVVIQARVDTGATGTSIDIVLAKSLGVYSKDKVLWYKTTVNSIGKERRPVVSLDFRLAGKRIKTIATVSKRSNLPFKILIGRNDLKGFLINPEVEEI